jgi:hypothetical protein
LLFVNSFKNFGAAAHRGLCERLAVAELVENTGFFVFFLILFERFVNVFAIFTIYYQHVENTLLVFGECKGSDLKNLTKFFCYEFFIFGIQWGWFHAKARRRGVQSTDLRGQGMEFNIRGGCFFAIRVFPPDLILCLGWWLRYVYGDYVEYI